MLHSHLDKFKDSMGAYLEEQGECFRHIMEFETPYKKQYTETSSELDRKSKTVPLSEKMNEWMFRFL